MNLLTEPLLELKEINEALSHINNNNLPILITGCMDAEKANVIETLCKASSKRHKIIIT